MREFRARYPRLATSAQAKELAEKIVVEAEGKVRDKRRKNPYQRKYKKAYNATWEGGKEDDITCVVAFAVAKH